MARAKHILFVTVFALSACASAPPTEQRVAPVESHQTPARHALPDGVLEWVHYVCNDIQDPAERAKLLQQSKEERGWIFTCPEEKTAAPPSQGEG
jgi:hypothetical protein